MKDKNILIAVLLPLLLVAISGCGRHYLMDRLDMHLSPALNGLPNKTTVVTYAVNPILDLSEGGDGRFAWTAIFWDKDGREEKYLALNLANFIGANNFIVIIPKPLSDVLGSRLAIIDHGGKRIYNHSGDFRFLDRTWKKINPDKYNDFLLKLSPDYKFIREIEKDSPEFVALAGLYEKFRIRDLEIARNYVYHKYGSNLTEQELDDIANQDSVIHGFIDWLGRDWKLFVFSGVTTSITGLVATAGIAKMFTLPSIWGDRIDRPGYMEHRPDTETVAKMILRAQDGYGARMVEIILRALEARGIKLQ